MSAVFVHGVPDTERVWKAIVSRLKREDVVTLSLPGFGCPTPEGFTATKDAYADWLMSKLISLPQPLDLVGHDWGALLVIRAASLRPDLVKSWSAGGAPLDREYQWHQTARLWQTPEVGEQVMNAMTPPTIQGALQAAAVPAKDAAEAADHVDDLMKQCILKLYRSALNVGAEWEDGLARIPPGGLVLWGEDDPYAAASFGARLAERTGARFRSFAGCGHWWQLQRPDEIAAELRSLWGR